ncbi:MAG: hypothetical protein HPY53_12275 [Brevinematales bacterium]|nr:hypothetical protein [Brevinematales bacterium]
MKVILYILFFLATGAILYPAPVKTPAPQSTPAKKAPLPKVTVLVSYTGYSDFYEFTASQDNYNLSAVYQSVMYLLPDYQTNFNFIDMNKMQFIPYSLEEDRKAIETIGLDYLIKINYHVLNYKTRVIEIAGLWSDGSRIVSNKIILIGTPGPDTFDKVYSSMQNVMKYMIKVDQGKQAGQQAGLNKEQVSSFIYTYLTNVNIVTITNKTIPTVTNIAPVETGIKTFYNDDEIKTLKVLGPYKYLEVANVLYHKTFTNAQIYDEKGYQVSIYPGLNILSFSMTKSTNKPGLLAYKEEKIFLINSKSLSSSTIDLKNYAHVPVHHIFLDATLSTIFNISYYFHFGIRIGLSTLSKLKLAIGYSDRLTGNQASLILGYEHAIFNDLNGPDIYRMEYRYSFFIDLNLNGSASSLSSGVNFRFNPLLSFSLGLEVGFYSEYESKFGFGVFARYDIYFPYPTEYRNYVMLN